MLDMPFDRGRSGLRTAGAGLACVALLAACEDRARLLTPSPGDGIGPHTVIDQPSRDTTIAGGEGIIVAAYSTDPDGVDTVYFRTFGPGPSFQPFVPNPVSDSVRLGLPIGTSGLTNDTIVIMIFATDARGIRGDTATRELYIP